MNGEIIINQNEYSDDNIQTLEGLEHVRLRPTMYVGVLDDGSDSDSGLYVLFKEVLDNCIDEFRMHEGRQIDISMDEYQVEVRDYGRGIPLGKMIEAVSVMNTGGKYDDKAFKKSVGLNGVGTKAVNALSSHFAVQSFREGKSRRAEFSEGKLVSDTGIYDDVTSERGTYICYKPDEKLFGNYRYNLEYVETKIRNFAYLNAGLTLNFNGKKIVSKNGLLDFLTENLTADALYPIIHLKGEDIEIAITHCNQNGEEYHSFVNGQHTTLGGTHQSAFREAAGRTIKEFYAKNQELADIRNGIVAAVSIAVEDPQFANQPKTKFGSTKMSNREDAVTVIKFISDFLKKELDNYLHRNAETANILLQKIQDSEKERKAIAGVTKQARERAKKVSLHNDKLRDCRLHFNDTPTKDETRNHMMNETSIFITEGNSASGSINESRNPNTQAVFSLRGKPKNSYGLTKRVVYENEEFDLLQAALNIEESIDNLRYNKVIIATDADDDGMHIRLLLLTFFLQFFPDLVKKGHVYILQTPLFRVRNKKETIYCYSENERLDALKRLGANPEITRFKGLGEISPSEFKNFINENIRLDRVMLRKGDAVADLLEFYMGKNTSERQVFIIDNLVVEEDDVN